MPKSFAPAERCFNLQMSPNQVGTPKSKVCTRDKIFWPCKFNSCQCQCPGLSLHKAALPSAVEGGRTGWPSPAMPPCSILGGICLSQSISYHWMPLWQSWLKRRCRWRGCSLPMPSHDSPEIVHTHWKKSNWRTCMWRRKASFSCRLQLKGAAKQAWIIGGRMM